MEAIFIIVIVISVLSPVVGLIFWYFVIKAAINHVSAFEKEERDLMRLINQYSNENYKGQIPSKINYQVKSKLMSMQNHLGQMDSLRQQQYETRISGMTSSVMNAGFTDFDPSSFY